MQYKVLVSVAGLDFALRPGSIATVGIDISEGVAQSLLRAGYIEVVTTEKDLPQVGGKSSTEVKVEKASRNDQTKTNTAVKMTSEKPTGDKE